MRNAYWIPIGCVTGLAAGAPWGVDYALAAALIGLAGGAGVFLGMKYRSSRR